MNPIGAPINGHPKMTPAQRSLRKNANHCWGNNKLNIKAKDAIIAGQNATIIVLMDNVRIISRIGLWRVTYTDGIKNTATTKTPTKKPPTNHIKLDSINFQVALSVP